MASEEGPVGQVIGVHTVEEWGEQLRKGAEAFKLIVVDFTASWCGPCRFIAPILADIAKKTPHVLFLKVDVDELSAVAQEHKVNAMPTFVFFKEGAEIHRIVGARKEELLAKVVEYGAVVA